jgi:glycosyltransferase involved in cell wall biosynthesis
MAEESRSGGEPRLLLITNALLRHPRGGREMLCKLNHDTLKDIYGDGLRVVQLVKPELGFFDRIRNACRGFLDGVDGKSSEAVLAILRTSAFDRVFIDGSNLGTLARSIKGAFAHVQVATFFHNVEVRFFWGAFMRRRTVRALGVVAVNFLAERRAVRSSDIRICLSDRDSEMLRRVYGRAATHVSAMALADQLHGEAARRGAVARGDFALFVGGLFYANLAGISWFVDQVVPRLSVKLVIVGSGFERHKVELERHGGVEVVGAVDDLSVWYLAARFVVAPIFDGSGMKTKVAEALMFGKKVVGTAEAFSGYEDVAAEVGWVCATSDEFVAAINQATQRLTKMFDPAMRDIYERRYSSKAAKSRLTAILGPTSSSGS